MYALLIDTFFATTNGYKYYVSLAFMSCDKSVAVLHCVQCLALFPFFQLEYIFLLRLELLKTVIRLRLRHEFFHELSVWTVTIGE